MFAENICHEDCLKRETLITIAWNISSISTSQFTYDQAGNKDASQISDPGQGRSLFGAGLIRLVLNCNPSFYTGSDVEGFLKKLGGGIEKQEGYRSNKDEFDLGKVGQDIGSRTGRRSSSIAHNSWVDIPSECFSGIGRRSSL